MKRREKNITKDLVKRHMFIKNELKKVFLKSVMQNKNTAPIIRSYAYFRFMMFRRKESISNQISVCLLRGRHKGVWKFTQLSRHVINNMALKGFLQNTKVKSW